MITLNDYLYNGDTVLKIIQNYSNDLKAESIKTGNTIDMLHSNFLLRIEELLVHNDFLTSQSQRIREFYKYMSDTYPFLAFTFKGRIKSLIRAEEKFNGYIIESISDQYKKDGTFPEPAIIKNRVEHFRDLIAYRIVISLPKCHLRDGADKNTEELKYLYEVADALPDFLEQRGFSAEVSAVNGDSFSERLRESVRPYFRDYIENSSSNGYQSLHITFYDNESRSYIEVQLRTKDMDDNAKIGSANHSGYEKRQNEKRVVRDRIPQGKNNYFDEAYERVKLLQELDLSKIDVNMFTAYDNTLINDGCGLSRGRLILPYEHLSRFQNDEID
jgi:hypothetical protein